MAISLALWVLERIYRLIRNARINSGGGSIKASQLATSRPYKDTPEAYGMSELKRDSKFSATTPMFTDKTLPRPPGAGTLTPGTVTPDLVEPEFGGKSDLSYYDDGSLQPLGSYDSRYSTDATYSGTRKGGQQGYFPTATSDKYAESPSSTLHQARNSIATLPVNSIAIPSPPPIPTGYAQAQLLPSRTIRLTIKVGHPFKWAPGQSVLLTLPELSRVQSHPFTILNNDPQEIILLVKARKGLTRKLFNLVRQRSLANVGLKPIKDKGYSLASMRASGHGDGVKVPPIYVRAKIDGPFGSSARVRWGEHSTVVIICGGSGVSFGIGICDYICGMIAKKADSRTFHTERVRFCWVAREYGKFFAGSAADDTADKPGITS